MSNTPCPHPGIPIIDPMDPDGRRIHPLWWRYFHDPDMASLQVKGQAVPSPSAATLGSNALAAMLLDGLDGEDGMPIPASAGADGLPGAPGPVGIGVPGEDGADGEAALLGVALNPGATVVSETALGQTANAGISTDYSRGDHTHGTPPDAPSDGSQYARQDGAWEKVKAPVVFPPPNRFLAVIGKRKIFQHRKLI